MTFAIGPNFSPAPSSPYRFSTAIDNGCLGGFGLASAAMLGIPLSPGGFPIPMTEGALPCCFNPTMQLAIAIQMMMELLGSLMRGGCHPMPLSPPGFGTGCCYPGLPGFVPGGLPGSVPGGTAGGWGPQGSCVDPSQIQGSSAMGQSLARDAARNANGPGGRCYQWVANALDRQGVHLHGQSAYMAADQLARNPKFREIQVSPRDLPRLPAGAVVVWDRGSGHPHGHISISLGDGREASDKIRQQITGYGTRVRVFLPVG